jgi:hypothetical protein
LIKKETENILTYKDLKSRNGARVECKIERHNCSNRVTGTISKYFRKYLNNIPGKHDIKEVQKITMFGTALILRKVLMCK